jgi:hypothetical protein
VRHPAQIEGQIFGVNGIIAAMTENRKMLLVNIADGKSATISPLPEILGEGLFGGQPCGQFAGITFDQGQLFIAGGDAHVWRLPWESVKGTLDWPIAQPAYKARP